MEGPSDGAALLTSSVSVDGCATFCSRPGPEATALAFEVDRVA